MLSPEEQDHITLIIVDHSRHSLQNRRSGGTAVLFKEHLNVQTIAARELRSIKYLELIVSSGGLKFRLVVLYRPPDSTRNSVTTNSFFIGLYGTLGNFNHFERTFGDNW